MTESFNAMHLITINDLQPSIYRRGALGEVLSKKKFIRLTNSSIVCI